MAKKKKTGYVVETKNGKVGKIYHNQDFVSNKIIVHIEKYENPILCEPESLKIKEYFKE